MPKRNWKTKSLAVTIVALLILVSNPELRAFMLILDFLGADLVLLLVGGYLHHYWPMFARIQSITSWVFKWLRWIAFGLIPRDSLWVNMDHFVIAGGTVGRIAVGRLRA